MLQPLVASLQITQPLHDSFLVGSGGQVRYVTQSLAELLCCTVALQPMLHTVLQLLSTVTSPSRAFKPLLLLLLLLDAERTAGSCRCRRTMLHTTRVPLPCRYVRGGLNSGR
jgi:hypothetical protein